MRKMLLAAALLVPLTAARAQVGVSVLAGLSSSNFSFSGSDAPTDGKSLTGFAGGLGVRFHLSTGVSIEPEALYVQKGYSVSSAQLTGQLRVNYIEVPLLLRVAIGERASRFFLFAGPHIAFRASCASAFTDGANEVDTSGCGNDAGQDTFKSTDVGITGGVGLSFGRLGVSARYDVGMSSVNGAGTSTDVKNRAWLFLASLNLK